MSEREPDFEFDFFEEPETQEGSGRGDRTLRRPRRAPKGPRMPRGPIRPGPGLTPLLRLLGLIAFAILIVVLLLLWAQSCQADKKRDAYGELHDGHRRGRRATPSGSAASSATC